MLLEQVALESRLPGRERFGTKGLHLLNGKRARVHAAAFEPRGILGVRIDGVRQPVLRVCAIVPATPAVPPCLPIEQRVLPGQKIALPVTTAERVVLPLF